MTDTPGWHRFRPLADHAVRGDQAGTPWRDALARLYEAASQGIGHLGPAQLDPPDAPLPPHLISCIDDHYMLPRQAAAWRQVRSFCAQGYTRRVPLTDDATIRAALDAILPHRREPEGIDNDQQRLAVAGLVDASCGVLTGGPGTGKTATAATLVALRSRLDPGLEADAILLAAPTGKAANRLRQSLIAATDHLHLNARERAMLQALQPVTLHRALGWSPLPPERGGPFRHNRANPLPQALVIVDEASMADIELMAALSAALAPHSSLILLGDRDQLDSVEAGGALAELVQRGASGELDHDWAQSLERRCGHDADTWRDGLDDSGHPQALPGLAYGLRHSWRARSAPWVLELAALVRPGASAGATAVSALCRRHDDPQRLQLVDPGPQLYAHCREHWQALIAACAAWRSDDLPAQTGSAVDAILGRFQLLVATNAQVAAANRRGLHLAWGHRPDPRNDSIPHGCPIIIEAGDATYGLANGDLGLAIGDGPGQAARVVCLADRDHPLPLSRLPRHRPAWGLTIHKSQGSQWAQVAVDLPEHAGEIMTRNLLYTAVTRSSGGVVLATSARALAATLDGTDSRP